MKIQKGDTEKDPKSQEAKQEQTPEHTNESAATDVLEEEVPVEQEFAKKEKEKVKMIEVEPQPQHNQEKMPDNSLVKQPPGTKEPIEVSAGNTPKQSTVRLIATDKKYEIAPAYVCPAEDQMTKEITTGSEHDIDAVREKAIKAFIKIDEQKQQYVESFPIRHGLSLRLDQPFDKAILNLALQSGLVAKSKAAINTAVHRYYVEDQEVEADETISKIELQFKAWNLIRQNSSLEDMIDLSTLLGIPTANRTRKQVEGNLATRSQTDPDSVMKIFDDVEREHKMFIQRLTRYKVVSNNNNIFKYNDLVIATSVDEFVVWMKSKDNMDVLRQLNGLLSEKMHN